ncbi:MAG: hypothetical protein ACE5HE_14700, partial [Phycisphaerae bacterium]
PRKTPINVDGDLSDWPLGSANVMSNFLLISGAGRGVAPGASVTPRRSTIGFVLKDEENLYIALNCECAPQLIPAASRQNHVFYEDMIPKAGELLEVLIDPTNGGTRSPADLYHIALMYSGADVIEKGMRFDPPCGRSEPWPVDIEVATRTTQGRWTAELRVPLVAFAPGATDHAVWGFNITRFDGLSKEFSTWSGALHNAYDPLSLGNLFLP